MRNILIGLLFIAGVTPAAAVPIGVYQGNGCDGVKKLENFKSWYRRSPDYVIDFFAMDSWESLQGDATWAVRCWAKAKMTVIFSVPMLPRGGATLAEGAAGKFDDQFKKLATLLVDNGYGSAVIRLGWEFNGGWYPWAAKQDPQNWVKYWQRIVTVMRAVPGAAFKFDWCSAQGYQQIPADQVYPGDAYVDIIGRDTYNQSWNPATQTPEQRWAELLNESYGLNWLRDFATKRGKRISIPEWGTGTRPDGHGGGDDANFISQMAAWMEQHNVIYHNYWDYPASDYDAQISTGKQPEAAKAFLKAFRGRARAPEAVTIR